MKIINIRYVLLALDNLKTYNYLQITKLQKILKMELIKKQANFYKY